MLTFIHTSDIYFVIITVSFFIFKFFVYHFILVVRHVITPEIFAVCFSGFMLQYCTVIAKYKNL